ncbi:MAG TPA: hypothetical protein VK610_01590, partial [Rhodothermales bacterium]|nr:hypothetical protein [Rhodothermales bacterium]
MNTPSVTRLTTARSRRLVSRSSAIGALLRLPAFAALLVVATPPGAAQVPTPLGEEFLVNTTTEH